MNRESGPASDPAATPETAEDPIGRFHTWWRGDPLPNLPDSPEIGIAPITNLQTAANLTRMDLEETRRRMAAGHQLWLARSGDEAVGWGWCATKHFAIGELAISRSLPPGNRYLWDFFTMPAERGEGFYPRLLQAIVRRDTAADRFWLGHDLNNEPSRKGIVKAGFQEVGLLYRQLGGGFLLAPSGPPERAIAAATLFGTPVAYVTPNDDLPDPGTQRP